MAAVDSTGGGWRGLAGGFLGVLDNVCVCPNEGFVCRDVPLSIFSLLYIRANMGSPYLFGHRYDLMELTSNPLTWGVMLAVDSVPAAVPYSLIW